MWFIKSIFLGMFKVFSYILKGYTLKQQEGARFASDREKSDIFRYSNKGVLINGKNKHLSEKDSFQHIGIIAKAGAGKTTGYIIPNILDKANQKCSMVITDPSGEIFENTSGYLKAKGYNILTLNPEDLKKSNRFNPFAGLTAENIIEIEQICSSIILSKYGNAKDGVWNDGAIAMLEIFAKCLAFSEPNKLNLPNINYLVQMFGQDGEALDDWVIDHSINPTDINDKSIINSWIGLTKNNKNMLSSYATIAKTALKQINNRQVQRLLSSNDLNLDKFRTEKTILYLIIPANQQSYYQFLIDVFYTRFFSQMMKNLPKRNDLNIYCFLDEFGSSYIHDFQALINNIRKYRVSLSMVFQSLSQLNDKYNHSADAVKGGIGSFLVYAGADYQTAKEVSDIIGKRLLIERNNFIDIEARYQELSLLSANSIRTLEDNKAVFLSKNHHPIIMDITPFYKHHGFKSATRRRAYELPDNRANDSIDFVNIWNNELEKALEKQKQKTNDYNY